MKYTTEIILFWKENGPFFHPLYSENKKKKVNSIPFVWGKQYFMYHLFSKMIKISGSLCCTVPEVVLHNNPESTALK